MTETWSHPELGTFKNDIEYWESSLPIPGFAIYPLAEEMTSADDQPLPEGHVLFRFMAADDMNDDVPPTDGQVTSALAFLKDAEAIAPRILDALWADINGNGPDSGMWWHGGGIEKINESGMYEEIGAEPVTSKEALLQTLEFAGVVVGIFDDPETIEVNFNPQWEEEHGVGVLIKNGEVVGLGYMMDAMPFKDIADN